MVSKFPEPHKINTWFEEKAVMAAHIRELSLSSSAATLNILEAGCGTSWGLDLKDIPYTLTGIDVDKRALELRLNHEKDLDIGICGDLRSVNLEEGKYDVIFNSYVLEHVAGAEDVLTNFVRWLKPGGLLVLVIPNRDSVWGFMARITPFWSHVLFRKYITGDANAGKPGYAPYPTFYDKIVSRRGIYEFCNKQGLNIAAEYSIGHGQRNKTKTAHALLITIAWIVEFASFKTLSAKHANLIYIIQKPSTS